jgi:hypothetical protein
MSYAEGTEMLGADLEVLLFKNKLLNPLKTKILFPLYKLNLDYSLKIKPFAVLVVGLNPTAGNGP